MSNIKMKLKKIDPVKSGVIVGAAMALLSFIMLAIMALFGGMIGGMTGGSDAMLSIIGGGLVALIFMPVFYFIIGFLSAWIGAMLLNFILKKTGGLKIEFEHSEESISLIGKE